MIEVARAIAKGKANGLKQLGLRQKNVNKPVCLFITPALQGRNSQSQSEIRKTFYSDDFRTDSISLRNSL